MVINNKEEFVILTEQELENICGEFFDKGYYANLYRTETTDNSTEIFFNCKNEILKKVIERSKQHMTKEELITKQTLK